MRLPKIITGAICVCLFMLDAPLFAQSLPVSKPEAVGMSTQRLGNIDQLLMDHIDREKIPGAVALVSRKGQVVYHRAMGMADPEATRTMETESIFRIASMTKPITAVAAMILWEEGRFDLDDPIYRYIPSFKDMQVIQPQEDGYTLVAANTPITVRHLLTHTSGLGYGFEEYPHLSELYTEKGISDGLSQTTGTLADYVEKVAQLPLGHQPGEAFTYGINADVLGRLIEIWSGHFLGDFMEERIFKPLNMKDTYFFLPQEKTDRLSGLYRPSKQGGIEKMPPELQKQKNSLYSSNYHYKGPRTYYSGGAGLVSTTEDYGHFLQMMINKGEWNEVRLLSRMTVELMTSNQTGDLYDGKKGHGFGFNLAVSQGPSESGILGAKGSYHWAGFFYTKFWVDPEEELFAILMVQMRPYKHLRLVEKFQTAVYQAIID